MPDVLSGSLAQLKRDEVHDIVRERLAKGDDPHKILDECRSGMEIVGQRYEKGEYFLAELMLAGEIFKSIAAILEPHMAREQAGGLLGRAVLATLRGDIHDLGKNIFAVMLKAQGFEVYDIGVDVEPAEVLEKSKTIRPDFVGFSALMTTAFDSMKEAAELLGKVGLRKKVNLMIGGGATNATVKQYVGADFQTLDAVEAVRYCVRMAGGKRVVE
ncbi:cobalamin B12-binding domain-containing protein [[Eubacterium] cellulosolvens]